jgi:hypothetical protein
LIMLTPGFGRFGRAGQTAPLPDLTALIKFLKRQFGLHH